MAIIILDRDGVINYDSAEYVKSPDEWIPIPGSLEAIAQLNRAGYVVFIATNQSGVARGYYDLETLSQIHEKFIRLLADVGGYVEEIFYCPHHPDDNCHCRKPKAGLLYQIRDKYKVDLSNTYFVGDSPGDVLAAQSAGCKPLIVKTGKGLITIRDPRFLSVPQFEDLSHVVKYILWGDEQAYH